MHCPYCDGTETKVLDSRSSETKIRRRRECIACGKRFTTYEMVERPLLMVQKRDGSFEPFDRNKLRIGILNAVKKTSYQHRTNFRSDRQYGSTVRRRNAKLCHLYRNRKRCYGTSETN